MTKDRNIRQQAEQAWEKYNDNVPCLPKDAFIRGFFAGYEVMTDPAYRRRLIACDIDELFNLLLKKD